MNDSPSFEDLARMEPRLQGLAAEAGAIRDDGSGSFFCSNFVWLPLTSRLQELVGPHRKSPEAAGEEVLRTSQAYEAAYRYLSRLLPPCRDCGCRRFQPVRDRQLAERS